ncbi:hypothetical protein [Schleiferilactobacillus shenzhenensis]|uniref:Uncharacterized protein n=1 Tax=Schleiferilactobacillus shenzhenensis LY-73 TaxID=1231336 RepID=U4TLV6_9LACO|nr:hypothetical protein [Schleiferilactobacillus shenzhenensis]ERL64370.1 hypothetical protein L248_1032 [Schleiferilactobacillus shenzhenensis LY-73]
MVWTIFMIALDAVLLVGCIVSIYWQAQIVLRAHFNYWPLILGILLMSWGWGGSTNMDSFSRWLIIIGLSGFLLNCIQAGVGGIGEKRLVNNGFVSTVIRYDRLAGITLVPVTLPNGKDRVVGIFITTAQQRVQLTFSQALPTIQGELRKLVPGSTPIEIQNIEQ